MKILKITIKDETVPVWAGVASSTAILAALGSQYLGGLHPCELCLWQRIPHGVIIVLALGALLWFRGKRERTIIAILVAIAFAFGTAIALYHVGVEQSWIQGSASCVGASALNQAQSTVELRKLLMASSLVRCDEISWTLFGLSIAAWNALTSLLLSIICVVASLRLLREKT
jgi:disulfide bond formation protein DsbB